ncbi:hypothetical protein BC828DRAFT_373327 [Blastocladiella britannica]|nr:hypothetical protein BC828DRAFT_373327 [Blastocladiella britannica]
MSVLGAAAKLPPKFAIQARSDHRSTSPVVLSFRAGEFFLVTDLAPRAASALPAPSLPAHLRDAPWDSIYEDYPWVEAADPQRNVRGLVPLVYFTVIHKSNHARSNAAPISPPFVGAGTSGASSMASSMLPTTTTSPGPSSTAAYDRRSNTSDHVRRASGGSMPGTPMTTASSAPPTPAPPMVYPATVQFDFAPEQDDELPARTGDHLLVLAHSGAEWVVAKFIGKLGDPGLIPVSYLEIRDPVSNKSIPDFNMILREGKLQSLKQWKARQQALADSAHSVGPAASAPPPAQPSTTRALSAANPSYPTLTPLPPAPRTVSTSGVSPRLAGLDLQLDSESTRSRQYSPSAAAIPRRSTSRDPGSPTAAGFQVPPSPRSGFPGGSSGGATSALLDPRAPITSVSVPSYDDRSPASVPAGGSATDTAFYAVHVARADGSRCVLFRHHQHFYDMHVALLAAFPKEAGQQSDPTSPRSRARALQDAFLDGNPGTRSSPANGAASRILPYLPGKVRDPVSAEIKSTRRAELELYLRTLVGVPSYILLHAAAATFFRPRAGDKLRRASSANVGGGGGGTSSSYSNGPPSPRLPDAYAGGYGSNGGSRAPSPSGPPPPMPPPPGPLPPPPSHTQSPYGGSSRYDDDRRRGSTDPRYGGDGNPNRDTMASSGTTRSAPPGAGAQPASPLSNLSLKIKIVYGTQVMAIRCNPSTINHSSLLAKVADKLFDGDMGRILRLLWRRPDDGAFIEIDDEAGLADAVRRSGDKMVVYIQ